MPDNKDTFSIGGVEVFASGTWNGTTYTNKDLDSMVTAFYDNKDKLRPFLKLGHDRDQKLLQSDGLPAAGWISDLKRVGDKLIAAFSDVPRKIHELIQSKAYRKVSSEIYHNIELNGRVQPFFLSGVALLGSDMPAVSSLDSILGLFNAGQYKTAKNYAENKKGVTIKQYEFKGDDMPQEILKEQLDKSDKKLETAKADFAKQDKASKVEIEKRDAEIVELKKFKQVQEKVNADLAEKAAVAEMDSQWVQLEKAGLPKSAKEFTLALLGPEKSEYTMGEKKLKKFELLSETLKLFKEAAKVNFDENSIAGDQNSQKEAVEQKRIETYMKDNDCDLREAYLAVTKND